MASLLFRRRLSPSATISRKILLHGKFSTLLGTLFFILCNSHCFIGNLNIEQKSAIFVNS